MCVSCRHGNFSGNYTKQVDRAAVPSISPPAAPSHTWYISPASKILFKNQLRPRLEAGKAFALWKFIRPGNCWGEGVGSRCITPTGPVSACSEALKKCEACEEQKVKENRIELRERKIKEKSRKGNPFQFTFSMAVAWLYRTTLRKSLETPLSSCWSNWIEFMAAPIPLTDWLSVCVRMCECECV